MKMSHGIQTKLPVKFPPNPFAGITSTLSVTFTYQSEKGTKVVKSCFANLIGYEPGPSQFPVLITYSVISQAFIICTERQV
jgi:hypothetical protein